MSLPPPYPWQLKVQAHAPSTNCFALLAEVATGKSRAAIMMLEQWFPHLPPRQKILIIAPSVALTNWKNELSLYGTLDLPQVIPLTNPSKRTKQVSELAMLDAAAIVIVNYEAFDSEIFERTVHSWGPQVIIADELHRLKSHTSKRAKAIVRLSDKAKYRLGLTGTAILNDPLDIWHQWRFIDHGETFGKFLKVFRAKYCREQVKRYGTREFVEHVFRKEMEAEFREELSKYSITVKMDDVRQDLPDRIIEVVELEMEGDQLSAYKAMKRDFLTYLKGVNSPAVAQTAMTKGLRLMQICSGFITSEDGTVTRFKHNPKLEYLESILPEVCNKNKIIVWCSFRENYSMVSELCDSLGIKYAMINGDMDAKEKGAAVLQFQTDDETRVMVANRRAGGIAVNMTAARYTYVFSRNFSLEEEIQSDGRNRRPGSEDFENLIKIEPTIKNSVDVHVLQAVQAKRDMASMLLDTSGAFL